MNPRRRSSDSDKLANKIYRIKLNPHGKNSILLECFYRSDNWNHIFCIRCCLRNSLSRISLHTSRPPLENLHHTSNNYHSSQHKFSICNRISDIWCPPRSTLPDKCLCIYHHTRNTPIYTSSSHRPFPHTLSIWGHTFSIYSYHHHHLRLHKCLSGNFSRKRSHSNRSLPHKINRYLERMNMFCIYDYKVHRYSYPNFHRTRLCNF